LADRVTALRDGRNAGELAKQEISPPTMIRLMVGRDLQPAAARQANFGEVQLRADRVVTNRFPTEATSLEVRAGEIVGIAGLVGSGRTELVNAIYGVEPRRSGEVTLGGRLLEANDPRASIEAGLVLVPEDRRTQALILASSVGDNLVLPRWEEFARNGLVQSGAVREEAQSLCVTYGVKAASVDVPVGTLSGGNQQKVVLAKWLSMKPKCLIVDEPTRGIDVGARDEIYEAMRELASQGVAILMVSSDLQEVLALSDRVIVMREGRMTGSLDWAMATEESVMELAVG
jgi:ribose transport system ATP-binding protein